MNNYRLAKPLGIDQDHWDSMTEDERRGVLDARASTARRMPHDIDPTKPDAAVWYFGEHACIELRGTKVTYTHLDRMLGENLTEDISETALGLILIAHGSDRG